MVFSSNSSLQATHQIKEIKQKPHIRHSWCTITLISYILPKIQHHLPIVPNLNKSVPLQHCSISLSDLSIFFLHPYHSLLSSCFLSSRSTTTFPLKNLYITLIFTLRLTLLSLSPKYFYLSFFSLSIIPTHYLGIPFLTFSITLSTVPNHISSPLPLIPSTTTFALINPGTYS